MEASQKNQNMAVSFFQARDLWGAVKKKQKE